MAPTRSDAVLAGFASPWEHARLLSDRRRNDAMIAFLSRHAPGRRVLEIGCGTGLLSCVAARLGASRVLAVEPTATAEVARELVTANGLADRVEVIEGRLEDLEPRPVDLAFSELLNADPFYEGVVELSHAATRWLAPRGRLAPRRLVVRVALLTAPESAREVRAAQDEVTRLGRAHGLEVDLLASLLDAEDSYRHVSHADPEHLLSAGAIAWDLALGEAPEPEAERIVEVTATDPGPVGAAVLWFDVELDEAAGLSNRPGEGGHWGQLVCAFSEERAVRRGERVALELEVDDGEVEVRWG